MPTLQPGSTSQAFDVDIGQTVSVTPGSGGTMLVEYTTNSETDIRNGSATWQAWTAGTVSSETSDVAMFPLFARVTAYTVAGEYGVSGNGLRAVPNRYLAWKSDVVSARDPGSAAAVVGAANGVLGVSTASNDSAGIEAAIAQIVASGKPGVVYLQAMDYTIDSDITLASNVSIIGVKPKLVFDGDVPDSGFSTDGGTRLILSAGVTGFKWNNVDKGVEETDIAENAISGMKLYGMTFVGGLRAIDIGAYLAMGATFCEFDELYGFDQTGDYAFNFVNFQHCEFGRIYTETSLSSGSGIRLGAAMSEKLLTGNSTIRAELYTHCTGRLNRSVTIEAFGPANCVLNQMKVAGRLQGNRYGLDTPDDIGMSFTSGSANIVVSDADDFALMQVDMPVAFASTTAGFSPVTVYFVRTRDEGTNTITLAETPYAATSINATSTTTGTAKCAGFPAVSIIGRAGNSLSNSDFGQIDAEGFKNVTALVLAKLRNSVAFISEAMESQTGTTLCVRDCEAGITYAGLDNLTMDESTLWGFANVRNMAGGPYAYSGGSFTLDPSWNGRRVRYTGTADITVTVPNNLPKGFEFSITPTGATGIVTFAASSGGAVRSFGDKLRTAGQYATAHLRMIANRYYQLSGDLQV